MSYKGTLVRNLQSVLEACLQRSSRICAEWRQTEERATRGSLNKPLGHFEDTE